jgi:hypothetical protein
LLASKSNGPFQPSVMNSRFVLGLLDRLVDSEGSLSSTTRP